MWERPFPRWLLGTDPVETEVQAPAAQATAFPWQLPRIGVLGVTAVHPRSGYCIYCLKETLRTLFLETAKERRPSYTDIISK